MFRVPQDPDNPTFDHTFQVGLGRWLTSRRAERKEWVRRRNAAARLAGRNQRQRSAAREARAEQLRTPAQPTSTTTPMPMHAPQQPDKSMRTLHRLTTVQLWLASIELGAYLLMLLVVLAVCGFGAWLLLF